MNLIRRLTDENNTELIAPPVSTASNLPSEKILPGDPPLVKRKKNAGLSTGKLKKLLEDKGINVCTTQYLCKILKGTFSYDSAVYMMDTAEQILSRFESCEKQIAKKKVRDFCKDMDDRDVRKIKKLAEELNLTERRNAIGLSTGKVIALLHLMGFYPLSYSAYKMATIGTYHTRTAIPIMKATDYILTCYEEMLKTI